MSLGVGEGDMYRNAGEEALHIIRRKTGKTMIPQMTKSVNKRRRVRGKIPVPVRWERCLCRGGGEVAPVFSPGHLVIAIFPRLGTI